MLKNSDADLIRYHNYPCDTLTKQLFHNVIMNDMSVNWYLINKETCLWLIFNENSPENRLELNFMIQTYFLYSLNRFLSDIKPTPKNYC